MVLFEKGEAPAVRAHLDRCRTASDEKRSDLYGSAPVIMWVAVLRYHYFHPCGGGSDPNPDGASFAASWIA